MWSILFQIIRYGSVAAVAITLGIVNLEARQSDIVPSSAWSSTYSYSTGWPLVCSNWLVSESTYSSPSTRTYPRTWNWFALVANLLSAVLILMSSLFVAHWVVPSYHRFRFRLASLMMAVLIAALLTCLLSFIIKYESEPLTLLLAQFSPELGRYYPLMLYSVWVFVPVFYGISCVVVTTCVGLRKALSHISQSIRRVAHGARMPPA